jgi:hypothetical protein
VIAAEILEDLQAALAQFAEIDSLIPIRSPFGLPVHVVRSHELHCRTISRSESLSDVLAGDGVQFLNCLMRQLKASASNILSQVFH